MMQRPQELKLRQKAPSDQPRMLHIFAQLLDRPLPAGPFVMGQVYPALSTLSDDVQDPVSPADDTSRRQHAITCRDGQAAGIHPVSLPSVNSIR